jgi:hypothetical protein
MEEGGEGREKAETPWGSKPPPHLHGRQGARRGLAPEEGKACSCGSTEGGVVGERRGPPSRERGCVAAAARSQAASQEDPCSRCKEPEWAAQLAEGEGGGLSNLK